MRAGHKNVPAIAAMAALMGLVGTACTSHDGYLNAQQRGEPEPMNAAPRLNAMTYFAHGHLLERQGNFTRAAEQYQQAIDKQPSFVTARNRLGITLNKAGRHSEASAAFREALRQQPNGAYLQNNLGFSLLLEGRPVEAELHLRRALEINPSFKRARINHGVALAKLGRFDEAQGEFATVCDPADACFNLAMVQADAGRIEQACESLQKALEINPELAAARSQLERLTPELAQIQAERARQAEREQAAAAIAATRRQSLEVEVADVRPAASAVRPVDSVEPAPIRLNLTPTPDRPAPSDGAEPVENDAPAPVNDDAPVANDAPAENGEPATPHDARTLPAEAAATPADEPAEARDEPITAAPQQVEAADEPVWTIGESIEAADEPAGEPVNENVGDCERYQAHPGMEGPTKTPPACPVAVGQGRPATLAADDEFTRRMLAVEAPRALLTPAGRVSFALAADEKTGTTPADVGGAQRVIDSQSTTPPPTPAPVPLAQQIAGLISSEHVQMLIEELRAESSLLAELLTSVRDLFSSDEAFDLSGAVETIIEENEVDAQALERIRGETLDREMSERVEP